VQRRRVGFRVIQYSIHQVRQCSIHQHTTGVCNVLLTLSTTCCNKANATLEKPWIMTTASCRTKPAPRSAMVCRALVEVSANCLPLCSCIGSHYITTWAARYNTWLLIELSPKVMVSILFLSIHLYPLHPIQWLSQ